MAGDWQVKKWLNSASAAAQNGAILTPDSIFRNGSQLKITPQRNRPEKVFPKELRPNFSDLVRIQVLKGPEYEQFTAEVRQQFFGKIHQISQQSNRMGYRLDKNLVGFAQNSELISSGVIPGTIQITNAGQPIILMRDAQTTGGYWRLGNVISEDLNKLAQLKPGDSVWFSLK